MGEQNVQLGNGESDRRRFMKALLNDVMALEKLLETERFERDIRRIGAEQEMFIVDEARRPVAAAEAIMSQIDDPRFTYELAKYNLEANLSPQVLGTDCLRRLESECNEVMQKARAAAASQGHDVVMTGILPTLRRKDLTLEQMIPKPRYRQLNDAIIQLRGSDFKLAIKGTDHLDLVHDNLMLEACNASFQVHFQVAPEEFANLYNIAQAVTAPVLAAAVNSPLLLGKRLWHETRIAVFEHSTDARSEAHRTRGLRPRVHFGDSWIENSVLEIFKEDIARFRIILTGDFESDPQAIVAAGGVPDLSALKLHNGTVYRWNRACYGITDGKPHLRIEHRVLPSGPSVLDEVANAAFFFGLMAEFADTLGDVRERLRFDDARSNFFAAARYGLQAQLTWLDDLHMPAQQLILEHLLPQARSGLARVNIHKRDIDRYMNVIAKRVESNRGGASWAIRSLESMDSSKTMDERLRNLTAAMVSQQQKDTPIHRWSLADFCETQDWRESYRTVSQFMSTDLFTVRPDDLVDFAASLMDWKHIRHVPVEDDAGKFVGLVSHRQLLRIVAEGKQVDKEPVAVRDIMNPEPLVISSECPTVDAIRIMRRERVACLPVVDAGTLVGVVTEADLINVAGKLLETFLETEL